MATAFTQENRVLKISTPLGKDVLLLQGFSGQEAISSLFHFHLDLLAENQTSVAFDKLLGQKVTVELMLPNEETRYFSGIISSLSQGGRDQTFTRYRAEMVPQFWLLTRRAQSRIFQTMTVPDILKKVLDGLDVKFDIQGTFQPRDYCTQYRESDFQFASRLMEEEGIYYFFKHSADSHKMVLANTPQSHPDLPGDSRIIYEELGGGTREEERIYRWEKVQDLRSGKYTLWDHCFELPHKHLEAEKPIQDSVQVGKVSHKLKVGGNDSLEIYDYPGAYAQRFDGVDPGGGDRASDLQKIFDDNGRTVGIRMQQEALPSVVINGASNCRHLVSGHKFNLTRHFNADGQYVITSLSHVAQHGYDAAGMDKADDHYSNVFTCIPFALPFRPLRSTPRPVVRGSQTAVVVGPSGEEIFTDKYGRVKVQFHWDREGKNDATSSCWVRVGTPWAGKNWGMIHIPRIGQEVVVDFLEGDPDQPIIIGSVYNADQMPPYGLPDNKTLSGIRSRSTLQGSTDNFNEIRFEDKKGSEQVILHAEKDLLESVENDTQEYVGNDRFLKVANDQKELVVNDKHVHVKGQFREKVESDMSHQVGGKRHEKVATVYVLDSGQEIHLKGGMKVIIEAGVQLSLKGPGGFVDIGPAGVTIQGTMVLINSGGAAGSGTAASPDDPEDPDISDIEKWGASS
ncbi:MAG TPA: type VI secretion system tip protein VgrG [Bryobacteraceae bacterium]|nr:type VI secretion system tip protein VgrG [Bryobacteraceae bacterium]